jgi:hypothetical protein
MVDPEEYLIPLTVEFDVEAPGAYTIEVGIGSTEPGENPTWESPMWVQAMGLWNDAPKLGCRTRQSNKLGRFCFAPEENAFGFRFVVAFSARDGRVHR